MEKTGRLWNLRFINILSFEIMYQFGAYMINSIIAVFAIGLGATFGIAGLIAGLNSGTSLAVRPITGFISDVFSKKSLLILSAIMFLCATVGCATFDSLIIVGFCRVIQGSSLALRSTCAVALASKVIPEDKLNRGMSWFGLSTVLSMGMGPVLADRVGTALGFHATFWIASVMLLICVVLALSFRVPTTAKETQETKRTFKISQLRDCFHLDSFLYRPNIIFALMGAFTGVPFGVTLSLVIPAAEQRGIEGAALFFTVYAVTIFIGRPIAGRVSDAIGANKVILPLLFIEIVSAALMMMMQSTWMLLLAAFLMGIGLGCSYPLLQAESVRDVDSQELGRAANTFFIGPDIYMGISPIIGSLLLSAFGVGVMYGFAMVCVACGALFYIVWLKRKERNNAE